MEETLKRLNDLLYNISTGGVKAYALPSPQTFKNVKFVLSFAGREFVFYSDKDITTEQLTKAVNDGLSGLISRHITAKIPFTGVVVNVAYDSGKCDIEILNHHTGVTLVKTHVHRMKVDTAETMVVLLMSTLGGE